MENNKTYKPLLIDSIKASVDLEKQRFVGFDGNYCQAGKKALGVIDAETEKEQFAPVAINGILLVVCGGIVNAFDDITSDAEGRAVVCTSQDTSNGFALDGGEEGDVIRIVRGI